MVKDRIKKIIVILLLISILLPNFSFAVDSNTQLNNMDTKDKLRVNNNKMAEIGNFKNETSTDASLLEKFKKRKNNTLYSEEYLEYLELSDEEKSKYTIIPNKYKVPLSVLYENTSDGELGASVYENENQEKIPLPSKFDLRDYIDIPSKNQAPWGTCWTFSCLRSLETYLALKGYGDYDFSEWHLAYVSGNGFYNVEGAADRGGNYQYFCDYLTKGYGPVFEAEVQYNSEVLEENFEDFVNMTPGVYIDEVEVFPSITKDPVNYTDEELTLFREKVKEHLMENGSVYTAIASGWIKENENNETVLFANPESEYYYPTDHAISIIGWDDNYSKENFKFTVEGEDGELEVVNNVPKNDGAYIALNSWGNRNELVYISYEDMNVEETLFGICSVSTEADVEEAYFEDINLYNALKEELAHKVISFDDNEQKITFINNSIFSLDLSNRNIRNLNGIEVFKNLSTIIISNNEIQSLEPLWSLEKLEAIEANNNNISNLGNVPKLKKMWFLALEGNNIENIDKLINLQNLSILALANNNISNIDVCRSLKKLQNISLSNNNIEDVSALEEYCIRVKNEKDWLSWLFADLDLSGNPVKIGLDKIIPNSMLIVLDDCGLDNSIIDLLILGSNLKFVSLEYNNITDVTQFSNLDLFEIHLSGNKNLNIETLENIKGAINGKDDEAYGLYVLELSDCNILDVTPLNNYSGSLILDDNPISDISPLGTKEGVLSLINTNVEDVSSLVNIEELYLSNSVNGLDSLSNLKVLIINNAGLEELGDIVKLSNLEKLDLSNNNISNIDELNQLENVYAIWFDNNQIINIDVIMDMPNLRQASFSNNNITSLEAFENFSKPIYLNISFNNIVELPDYPYIEDNWIIDFENLISEYSFERNEDNIVKLPYSLKKEYENKYYYGYENRTKFVTENCVVDWNNDLIIVNPKEATNGMAKITAKTLYGDKTYTINYNVVNSLELEGIYVDSSSKNVYMAGETVSKDDLVVVEVYNGGTTRITEDYVIFNGEEISEEQEEIVIQSTKNPDFRVNYSLQVLHNAVKLKIDNERLYEIFKYNVKYYSNTDRVYYTFINDENKELYFSEYSIGDITEIYIPAPNENLTNLNFLRLFPNLKIIELNVNSVVSFEGLKNNLEEVYVHIHDDQNLEELLNSEAYKTCEHFNIEKMDSLDNPKNVEYVELPNYIYQSIELQNGENIEINLNYYDNNGNWVSEELLYDMIEIDKVNKTAKLKLDNEISNTKGSGTRIISVSVLGGNCEGAVIGFAVEYNTYEAQYVTVQDLQDTYIENMLPNTRIFDLRDKIDTNCRVEFYKGTERIYDVTQKVSTGMLVRVITDEKIHEFKTVVTGDLIGNGECQDADLLKLARYKAGLDLNLINEYLEASDINLNGENADDADLLKLARILTGWDNF